MTHGKPPAPPAATATPETSARAQRFTARSFLWEVSGLPRVKACGRAPVGSAVGVRHIPTADGGSAGFSGLETCGSVWACPVCSAKVRQARSEELAGALRHHLGTGGSAFLLTLTMRHRPDKDGRTPPLDDLWPALSAAWKAATNGRAWRGEKETAGILGIARYVEATHGRNGWHLHVHAVMFLAGSPDPATVRLMSEAMFQRWRDRLVSDGFMAPVANRGGLDIRPVYAPEELGSYLGGIGKDDGGIADLASRASREATRGDMKQARKGNRTPWRILADFSETGEAQDYALWREWETASHNRRFTTWSRSGSSPEWDAILAARGEDKTDEELAAEDLGGETLGYIGSEGWRRIRANGPLLDRVLHAAATGSADAVALVLDEVGVTLWLSPPGRVAAA